MKQILPFVTIISSILLIITILLQNQASSLGSGFGGETNFYRSKRGAEKTLFMITIILAVVFVSSILGLLFVK